MRRVDTEKSMPEATQASAAVPTVATVVVEVCKIWESHLLLGWQRRRQCRGVIALVKGVCLMCSVNDITMVGTN